MGTYFKELDLNTKQIGSLYQTVHRITKKSYVTFHHEQKIILHHDGTDEHFRSLFKMSTTHLFVRFKNGKTSFMIAPCSNDRFPVYNRFDLDGDEFKFAGTIRFGETRTLFSKIEYYATLTSRSNSEYKTKYRTNSHRRFKPIKYNYSIKRAPSRRDIILKRINQMVHKINLIEFNMSIIDSIKSGDYNAAIKKSHIANTLKARQFTDYSLFQKYATKPPYPLYGDSSFESRNEIRAICLDIIKNIIQDLYDIMYKDEIEKLLAD